MIQEFRLLKKIRKKIPQVLQGSLGLEDDAAVLKGKGSDDWLLTTDCLVEGVDFLRRKTPAEWVGRKALAINLSDIAAMGGTPVACLIALGIPGSMSVRWIEKFYEGLTRLAEQFQTLCVGGDISRAKQFFASVSLIGRVRRHQYVSRRGARPGDWIAVTGRLGGSILGKHLRFEPRVAEGKFLARYFRPSAMMDISDGFAQDLEHILIQSKVRAKVDLDKIPVSPAAKKMGKGSGPASLRHALTDGEDFELLFTLPPRSVTKLDRAWKRYFPKVPLSWVGRIASGKGKIQWLCGTEPVSNPVPGRKGYVHFA